MGLGVEQVAKCKTQVEPNSQDGHVNIAVHCTAISRHAVVDRTTEDREPGRIEIYPSFRAADNEASDDRTKDIDR